MSPRIGLDLYVILEAATELADKDGLESVTLASLAKKLQIRPPSLYNHFDGLGGLRKKMAVYSMRKLYDDLADATIGKSGDEAIISLGHAYITFARQHPGLYEASIHAPDPTDKEVSEAGSQIVTLVVKVLQAYNLEDEAALHAVRGLRSILHGFASLEQKGGFGLPLDLDHTFHLLLQSFLAGIHTFESKQKS
ncbi:TetR/AcrR family transcriptional regulator [Bacillus sp. HMF5848]|uniref:TetR/AcrR family transcriptional regulator n=1 Tax=Bacillus sp. HMF5848 TaxID=2495421 RepID=UPI000F78C761|nr:TetR/AcrR family transcriptional regulator [Bacillus sp. HMF5848]RSK25923.1 TetR/AcrR family transcriptional regulator [Bacillus sp. HMF5848]